MNIDILIRPIQIPKTWKWIKLYKLASKFQAGGTPSRKKAEFYENGKIPFVKIDDITNQKKYLLNTKEQITEKGLENSSAWIVPKNSLLYSMYASYGIPIINKIEVATNQAIIAFLPNETVELEYVYYYLIFLKPYLINIIQGTTQLNLNGTIVKNFDIPICPLTTQKLIINKINELFSKLDSGLASLQRTKLLLKHHRQAVLKAAMIGELTKEWREKHLHELEPASVLLERILKERRQKWEEEQLAQLKTKISIPNEWFAYKLGDIAEINPTYDKTLDLETEVTFLPMRKVEEQTGIIDMSLTRRLKDVKKGYRFFKNGDIVFAKITPCMENGKIAIVDNLYNGYGIGSTEFHVIRFLEGLYNKFYFYFLNREELRNIAKKNMTGSVGQKRVPTQFIKDLIVPIPSTREQKIIVEKIEEFITVIEANEKTIEQGFIKINSLKQSILKSAFEGTLVQDIAAKENKLDNDKLKEGEIKVLRTKQITLNGWK